MNTPAHTPDDDSAARLVPPGEAFPSARVVQDLSWPARLRELLGSRAWWITLACLLVAVGLFLYAYGGGEPQVTVRFRDGHGIKPGDPLRYRGVDVGEVHSVNLSPELDYFDVRIRLDPSAEALAREGSRFWIERPRVSLSGVQGLETVVGAKYVGVLPGPADSPTAESFIGQENPPTLSADSVVEITIHFRDGHGLAVGDVLKYRGIVVGEVTRARLAEDLGGLTVQVQLVDGAQRLARAGSQFWIERPRLSLTEVRGLDTVVGGRYLAVSPGPVDAEPLRTFQGLDTAPALVERPEGGLEIVFESPQRSGLEPGAPVKYRGIQVGQVTSVGLSSDAVAVEARAYILPDHRRLVRNNTQFWSISGVQLNMGLSGLRLDVESLATLASGGVALSTPQPPGALVATGHRFTLHAKPEDHWLAWQPRIPLGSALLPNDATPPEPIRAALRWKERVLGFPRDRQIDSWLLLAAGGKLIGPRDALTPPGAENSPQATLALAGRELAFDSQRLTSFGELAAYTLAENELPSEPAWPTGRMRVPQAPEDCLLVRDCQGGHIALSGGRITVDAEGRWRIDPALSLDADRHGACVVSRKDGRLIGLLALDRGQAQVIPLSAELLK